MNLLWWVVGINCDVLGYLDVRGRSRNRQSDEINK